jgi:hypothetical protein
VDAVDQSEETGTMKENVRNLFGKPATVINKMMDSGTINPRTGERRNWGWDLLSDTLIPTTGGRLDVADSIHRVDSKRIRDEEDLKSKAKYARVELNRYIATGLSMDDPAIVRLKQKADEAQQDLDSAIYTGRKQRARLERHLELAARNGLAP